MLEFKCLTVDEIAQLLSENKSYVKKLLLKYFKVFKHKNTIRVPEEEFTRLALMFELAKKTNKTQSAVVKKCQNKTKEEILKMLAARSLE